MLWKQPLTSEWRRACPRPRDSLFAISSSTVSVTSALRPPLLAPSFFSNPPACLQMQPSGSLHEETASVQRQFSGVDPCSYVKVHRGGKGWQGNDPRRGKTMNRLWSWTLKAALTFQQASVLPERGTPSWPRPSKHTAESHPCQQGSRGHGFPFLTWNSEEPSGVLS